MTQRYNTNLRAAAYRHQDAAEKLYDAGRRDVAGYLFGLAAECGFKSLMLRLGMRPATDGQRSNDPFYAHFTKLKALLRDGALGRRQNELRKFFIDDRFMENWDIAMRYSDGKDIQEDWVNRWRQNVKDILAEV